MREEFQMIEWVEPPIGDLVEEAVAKGRRRRTAKRFRVGGAGLAVLAVAGLAAVLVVRSTAAPSSAVPGVVTAAAPSPAASSSAPARQVDRVKGTPAGLLELLIENLPEGKTSRYAGVVEYGDVSVQTFLDRGQGPGMIRLHVMTRKAADFTGTWTPLGNGTEYLVFKAPSNCLQDTIVYVHHADDTLLQFDLSNLRPEGLDPDCSRGSRGRRGPTLGCEDRPGPQRTRRRGIPTPAGRAQVSRGDDDFVEYARASAGRLRRTAYLLCRDWELAADLTQTTLVRMFERWQRIARRDNPHAYARQVLYRAFLDHHRSKRSQEMTTADFGDVPGRSEDADLRLTLIDALARIPPRDRAIVVLRYWEDLSVESVAEILDLPTGTVTSQSARSLARLRQLLGQQAGPTPDNSLFA
ncbi:SigE family RNA polymerase sigma factor [Actinoplanes sp. NPDC049548]|uniref:SigE family RNA polymerase sigma factor n=1 Tax=Actinoplanes sp. NPDC049548 TaxID=3155152 RepID=UPI00343C9F63